MHHRSTSVTSSSIDGHARQGWIKPLLVVGGTSEGGSEFGLPRKMGCEAFQICPAMPLE